MAQQTFKAKEPSRTNHVVTIDGYYLDDRRDDAGEPATWTERLEFRAQAAFADVNAVMRAFAVVDGQLITNGLDVQDFLLSCATDESRQVLAELMESHDRAVDVMTLGQVTMFLIEQYGGRPTTR